ncbi:group II intron maturase-specific domain-containing protein [Algoriphagus sp. C2-6-M1]|uniref:group II intron maturase-specific domain-containing protein n=1 Tax=Algoriphagus persicinus TaxID=3108754 RepID=UPI002B3D8A54|nr:group II intron maturase-specific domain-containing protein [Algoriphagus sp. C2-6-M1]MEB2779693.1 group II intron maturase-specific domain-containing protein [Algoriphagus sp. C2-6-M1]
MPTYKKGEKGKYQLVVKKQSWENLKRKLKQLTKKTKPYSFEERLQKLREVWMGWVNNYRLASIQAKLKQLDEWLRNTQYS